MENFEEKLQKLEELSNDIKRSGISLEDALKDFEEGIKLAKGMEKEIDSIESKIQILMKQPSETDDGSTPPQLETFNGSTEVNGTRIG